MKYPKSIITLLVFTLLFTSLLFMGCPPPPPPPEALIGKWAAVGPGGGAGVITFNADGTVVAKGTGQEERATYEVDFSKDPAWLDFISEPNGQRQRRECIIKFNNYNEIVIAGEVVGDPRPVSFDYHYTIFHRLAE
jgi:uncharacterized protein (TIGR03067 family)